MPVEERCPETYAEWNGIDEKTGREVTKRLYSDTVIKMIANGATSFEISQRFKCPLQVVEHCIMVIPQVIVWRDQQLPEVFFDPSIEIVGDRK